MSTKRLPWAFAIRLALTLLPSTFFHAQSTAAQAEAWIALGRRRSSPGEGLRRRYRLADGRCIRPFPGLSFELPRRSQSGQRRCDWRWCGRHHRRLRLAYYVDSQYLPPGVTQHATLNIGWPSSSQAISIILLAPDGTASNAQVNLSNFRQFDVSNL